ncbi:Ig-like domain-containing protein [Halocalculus aciditolerans]|uniref:Ig-like domain-containing protein n=1 Tax=Halocalculus aciditolerans TaxID=1383812 RepID=UPI00166418FD|nr:Ig-like domain-containing protein [Halocalculus aciditolerans]
MSEILGAILLFGVVLAVLVLVQVTAVPAWNQQVEFQHNQRVQGDMAQFGDAVTRTASDGTAQSVAIEMGTNYPPRPFLLNPPAASGVIRTTQRAPVTIANAESPEPDVGDYWNGDTHTLDTKAIEYAPRYNQYQNAPTTIYEPGALYDFWRGSGSNGDEGVVIGGTKPVSGTNVNLVTVQGELNESGVQPQSIDVSASSAPSRSFAVQSADGQPIHVEVRTKLPASVWETDYLADQPNVLDVTESDVDASTGLRTVDIQLRASDADGPITYTFNLASVNVGSSGATPPAKYVVKTSGGGYTPSGSQTELTAQARDRYNNPVAGVPITFTDTSGAGSFVGGSGESVTVTTDSDGKATATYTAPSGAYADIEIGARAENDLGTSATAQATEFHLSTVLSGGTTGSAEDQGLNPAGGKSVYLRSISNPSDNKGKWVLTFENRDASASRTWTGIRVNFYKPQSGSGNSNPPTSYTVSRDATQIASGSVRGNYATLSGGGLTFTREGTAGDSHTLTFSFTGGSAPDSRDIFVISVEWSDGSATYIVG